LVPACAVCGYQAVHAFKFCPECGTAAGPAGSEQRKVVTVLFCDVVGSTGLGESTDPEALRALLARYFERMKQIVERHEGSVEKFIGDAVMAVFGVPLAHEDDTLRACRAAVEMREAFPELRLQGRIGLTTGEVVTGTEERLVTGDAVNVAARLQQAAQPGEVLIGNPRSRLFAAPSRRQRSSRSRSKGSRSRCPPSAYSRRAERLSGPTRPASSAESRSWRSSRPRGKGHVPTGAAS
jgi:class 3 adenylate cyclase